MHLHKSLSSKYKIFLERHRQHLQKFMIQHQTHTNTLINACRVTPLKNSRLPLVVVLLPTKLELRQPLRLC